MQAQTFSPVEKLADQTLSRQQRRKIERSLKKVKIIPDQVWQMASDRKSLKLRLSPLPRSGRELEFCLPERTSHRSVGSYLLALLVIAGHIRGVENLTWLKRVRNDPYLSELFEDQVAAVRTIGDFLSDFTPAHVEKLNIFLNKMAKAIYEHLSYTLPEQSRPEFFCLDLDSTHHVHFGEEIQGLWFNYKNQWCLQSHIAFDNLGLCHGIDLQPGNTRPGTGAVEFMERVFKDHRQSRLRRLQAQDYFRADSAYCNQDVIKKCLELGVHFTITAHKSTTGWAQLMATEGLHWEPWIYSEEDQKKAAKANQELPRCEVTRLFWQPSWSEGTLKLPIVITRTFVKFSQLKDKMKKHGQKNLFELDTIKEEGEWQYYAIVTNIDLSKWSLQEVVEHHRKRGTSENFIKNGKYNFYLKNFPCQKLLANNAWAGLAQIAYNMLRWIAVLDNPDHPSFTKRIRDDFIFHAGKLAYTSRQVFLRTTTEFQEVINKIEGWQFPGFSSARIFSTA